MEVVSVDRFGVRRVKCPVCKRTAKLQFKDARNPEHRTYVVAFHLRKGDGCDGSFKEATK
jgi:hypothetical protein